MAKKEIEEDVEAPKKSTKVKEIADLPGVGDKIAEKLKSAGYIDMMAVAAAAPWELEETAGLGEGTAGKIIQAARDTLDMGFESATKVLERRQKIVKITTGSKNLNNLIGGGVETGATYEFHGGFGSGKSQIAHQLAVNVQLSAEKGGMEGGCLYIDTEGTFRPERIQQMAKAVGIDPEEALSKVMVARAYNSDHQCILVEKASEIVRDKNIKLIVVDSVTALFRSDYTGRGELAPRQQRLNRHLHALQRLADVYNVAIYMTNQVMARPDIMYGDPTTPIGGHVMGHFATVRCYLRKSKGDTRIARMIDSPSLPEGECVFTVTPGGISDPEEKD
jgi:DNA repair protein RadA